MSQTYEDGSGMQCAAMHESGQPGAVVAAAQQRYYRRGPK